MFYLSNTSTTRDTTLKISNFAEICDRCDSKKHKTTVVYARTRARVRGGMRDETYSF